MVQLFLIAVWTVLVFLGGLVLGVQVAKAKFLSMLEDDTIDHYKLPRCDCKDVNQCSKWCQSKERFTKDYDDGKI